MSIEESFQNRYKRAAEGLQRGFSEYQFASTMSFQTLMSVAGLSVVICLGLGGWLVVKGALSVGMLFAAINYFMSLSNNFTNVIEYGIHIRASKKIVEKLDGQRRIEGTLESGAELAAPLDPVTRDLLNEMIFSLQGYTRIVITHDRREDYIARFDGAVML